MIYQDQNEKRVVLIALVSRLFLLLGTFLLIKFFSEPTVQDSFFSFLTTFAGQWDGGHYIFLAQNGYVSYWDKEVLIVFPPFFPLLIKVSSFFFHNYNLTGVILANLFFILGCLTFYKLLKLDYPEDFSENVILVLSLFPTSYFFSSAYPESLLLFLVSASLLSARKERFLSASFLAGLATLTKPFGLLLYPPLLIEWYKTKEKSLKNLFYILFSLAFFYGFYLLINYLVLGDFFAFQKFLGDYWQKSFTFPWVGLTEVWKRAIFSSGWTYGRIVVGFAESITATLAWFVVLLGITSWAKMRFSYSTYLFLGVLLFTSTGFILSGPRYLLSIPPFFILFTRLIRHKIIKIVWLGFSVFSLLYLSLSFAENGWAF